MKWMVKDMEKRERSYARLNIWLRIAYALINAGLGVYNVIMGYPYYYLLAFGALLFIPFVDGFYKVCRLKPVEQLNTIVYAFIFLSYTVGLVMVGYYRIPHFDKVCHGLSGTFVGLLGAIIFYILKPGRRVERSDCGLCIVFMFCFSMAIAGIWELCEYAISLLFGTDPQWVAGTGVGDTMTDMLVCMAGTLALLPSLLRFYLRGRADALTGAVAAFCEKNPGGAARTGSGVT